MKAALADLQRGHDIARTSGRIGFYLSLPDPERLNTGQDLLRDQSVDEVEEPEPVSEDDEGSPDIDADDTEDEGEPDELDQGTDDEPAIQESPAAEPSFQEKGQTLLLRAAQLSRWPGEVSMRGLARSGNTGVAEVLQNALNDLRSGQVALAVVGGADSWLDEDTLLWLEDTGRLKTMAAPTGLQPGEAAVFLLLESLRNAKLRHRRVLAVLSDIRLRQEKDTLLSGKLSQGRIVADLLSEVAETADWGDHNVPWLVTDQNGETYRATEWGNANVCLASRFPVFSNPTLWYPAASFGDTGAASAGVGAVASICAFARGYAPAPVAAVVSSSDGPLRSVILLHRAADT
jgi:3-oxoacyl-[acyl-carrier-protein] synthase-1